MILVLITRGLKTGSRYSVGKRVNEYLLEVVLTGEHFVALFLFSLECVCSKIGVLYSLALRLLL